MHTHRDFAFNTEVYAKRTVGYRRDDVTVSVPRLFFGYATGTNLMFPFAVGATAVCSPSGPTPESLAAAIASYRPTVVTNVPTMMGKLLDLDDERVARGEGPGLDLFVHPVPSLGGRGAAAAAARALHGPLRQRGLRRHRLGRDVSHLREQPARRHQAGLARPGRRGLRDSHPAEGRGRARRRADVPRGEIGVMWVRGDSVALGYSPRPRQELARPSTATGAGPATCSVSTTSGYLWFCGRADDLFKVGGVFVAPLEVEECLIEHAAVAAGRGHPRGGRRPVTSPRRSLSCARKRRPADGRRVRRRARAELQDHVKARLSKHKYPRWVVRGRSARNDRGKIDRKALIDATRGVESMAIETLDLFAARLTTQPNSVRRWAASACR